MNCHIAGAIERRLLPVGDLRTKPPPSMAPRMQASRYLLRKRTKKRALIQNKALPQRACQTSKSLCFFFQKEALTSF
jgi:hypothetical protein